MVFGLLRLLARSYGAGPGPTTAVRQAAFAASYQSGPQSQAWGICSADVYSLAESPTEVKFLNFPDSTSGRLNSFFPRVLLFVNPRFFHRDQFPGLMHQTCTQPHSVFTSGAYRATAPNAAFPQEPGSPASKLAGVEVKPHFAALSCSE
jgi:hypothetical protein